MRRLASTLASSTTLPSIQVVVRWPSGTKPWLLVKVLTSGIRCVFLMLCVLHRKMLVISRLKTGYALPSLTSKTKYRPKSPIQGLSSRRLDVLKPWLLASVMLLSA